MIKKVMFIILFLINFLFGESLENGINAFNKGDYEKAFTIWEDLAKKGNKVAQYNLGYIYSKGLGVKINFKQSFEWYEKAFLQYEDLAKKGDAEAQNKIGDMYFYEQGVGQDYKKAALWYEKAANQGHKIAQYNTAYLYKKSYKSEKAIKWYEKSANQGYRDAQYEMGKIYAYGLNPIKSDLNKAINWFEKAANLGHIESQNILGRLYKYQDPKKSFKWYEKAANQGSPEAEYEIGLFYYQGIIVEQDKNKAIQLWKKACIAQDQSACEYYRIYGTTPKR